MQSVTPPMVSGLKGLTVTGEVTGVEEGLATVAEERIGTLHPRFLYRQSLVHSAMRLAKRQGFREIFDYLRPLLGRIQVRQQMQHHQRDQVGPSEGIEEFHPARIGQSQAKDRYRAKNDAGKQNEVIHGHNDNCK